MSKSKRSVEFFYDVISAYSWFSFEVLCRYQQPWNLSLKLRPVFLGGLINAANNKGPAFIPNKFVHMMDDLTRLGKYFSVPIHIPKHPEEMIKTKGTLNAQRFLTAVDMTQPQMLEKVSRELWMRCWSRDEDIFKPESVVEAAIKAGIPQQDAATILSTTKTDEVKERLKKTTQDALDMGAFGVPTIFIDVNGTRTLVFGSDRFHILADLIERDDLCREWVSMLAAANIPISKTDHPAVREFLRKRVVNGGAIPHAKQLQECYLNREASRRVEEVKAIMKGKPVAISTDEMSDANGRFVLNILAAPLELTDGRVKSYLMDTVFLENTNHSNVAAAVVKTVTKFEIEYEDVMVVNTDNAAYMKKVYKDIWSNLFPSSVHITCLAHIANLFGDTFKKPFTDITKFVKIMNAMFWNAGGRKARYLTYLKSVKPDKRPKMPPNPIGTRFGALEDLQFAFYRGSVSLLQAEAYFLDEFKSGDKLYLMDIFNQAYALVADKIEKYMSEEGQPGIHFLQSVQFFDPAKLVLGVDKSGVPSLSDVPELEIIRYSSKLGPAAVKNSPESGLDCELFWKSCAPELPRLSALARRYMFATVNSADVERSFSLYNLIHCERRRSLGEQTIKQLLFLYYNNFAGRDFFY